MRKVSANFEKNWEGRPFLINSHGKEKIQFFMMIFENAIFPNFFRGLGRGT